MTQQHSEHVGRNPAAHVFATEDSPRLVLAFDFDHGAAYVHLPPEDATALAWAILRGAAFVAVHKQEAVTV